MSVATEVRRMFTIEEDLVREINVDSFRGDYYLVFVSNRGSEGEGYIVSDFIKDHDKPYIGVQIPTGLDESYSYKDFPTITEDYILTFVALELEDRLLFGNVGNLYYFCKNIPDCLQEIQEKAYCSEYNDNIIGFPSLKKVQNNTLKKLNNGVVASF